MKIFGRITHGDDRIRELNNMISLAKHNNLEIDSISLSESAYNDIIFRIHVDKDGDDIYKGIKIKDITNDMVLNIKDQNGKKK